MTMMMMMMMMMMTMMMMMMMITRKHMMTVKITKERKILELKVRYNT